MIKGCIFDLDGTLLDTLTTISHYANRSLKNYGCSAICKERYKYLVGDGAKNLIARMISEVNADEKLFDKMYSFYNKEYNSDPAYLTKPYDGVPELLSELKIKNIKTAVLSNKPDYAAKVAVKTLLGYLIDHVRGATDDVAIKPSTEGLNLILSEMGLKSDECIYIGDTSVDMQTGRAGGVFTIGVLWGFRKRDELIDSGANFIANTPSDILKCISELV